MAYCKHQIDTAVSVCGDCGISPLSPTELQGLHGRGRKVDNVPLSGHGMKFKDWAEEREALETPAQAELRRRFGEEFRRRAEEDFPPASGGMAAFQAQGEFTGQVPGRPGLGPWFVAAYDGTCSECGEAITDGDEIRADGYGKWLGRCCGGDDD